MHLRLPIVVLALAAATALAKPLPFGDGFEPPESNFSNWSSVRLNGSNTLLQSTARAWDDTRSLTFSYAGASAAAQAAAVVDFDAATPSLFVRFFFFVPVGTAASMASGSTLRLVKLGDAASGASGSGGNAKVGLLLRKDATGPIHLRLDYANNLGGTTTYGTALTTPITEGTWHYVELGYQPSAPRVRVFIDDPVSARIDAAPSDMVAANLLTCWLGLADAADGQSIPISLSFDDVQLATAQTGTALATHQHFNEVESGTLAVTNTPPGKASVLFLAGGANVGVVATASAAHRGSYGVRLTDGDGSAGPGNGAGETVRLTGVQGTLYRRFFWRPATTNGLGSRTLANLTSSTIANKALAEVIVAGNGTLSLGGYDQAQSYLTTSSTTVASTAAWHLVELVTVGLGTASGTRKLYLDGTLVAQAGGINWTGVSADQLSEGQVYSNDRTFQGTDDFDDLRASTEVMPSKLVVSGAPMTDHACSSAITIGAADSDGTPRQVPEPMVANLLAAGVPGGFYSDPGCTTPVSTVSFAAGASSATVYFLPTAAGTATLTAANVDYLPSPDVEPVASLATQLALLGAGQTVAAGSCSALAVVQSSDATGAAATVAAPTSVSLSSTSATMGFYSNPSCTAAVTSVIIPAGSSSAGFYFKDTVSASPSVTVAATGLTSGNQVETIVAASPSKLVFFTPQRTVTAGSCSQVVTVQSQDTYGNPSVVGTSQLVTFSSSSGGGSFFSDSSCLAGGSSVSLAAGASTVDIYFEDTAAGTPLLTASAAGFLNGTQAEQVGPAAVTQLAFSTPPQTITAGACSGLTTVMSLDPFGNQSQVSQDVVFALQSMPANVTFYAGPGCTNAVSQLTMFAGTSTRGLYFISSAAGTVALTAHATGLGDASQTETIAASGPTQLVFISAPQNVAAGSCSSAGLIQAQDSFGNPAAVAADVTLDLSSSSTTLTFAPTGACASSVGTVVLPAGTDTTAVYFKDTMAGAPAITATAASGLSPATQTETIHAAPPSALAFQTAAQTLTAGACSPAIIAEARDGFGNPSAVVSNTTVTLTTSSPSGKFYGSSGCTSAITTATIAASSSSATFYYRDTLVGTPTLRASNPGLSAPTQTATVTPAAPAKLKFVTGAQTLTAGDCSAIATVEVHDAFDNPSPVSAATTVGLSSSSATMGFASDNACAAQVPSVTVLSGDTRASFYFSEPTAGAPTVIAAVTGLTSATQIETIKVGAPAKLSFVNPPRTVVAGTCSQVLTVQQQDRTGNAVPFSSATAVAVSTSSTTGALYSDSSCMTAVTQITIASGMSSGDLYFHDTKTGRWGVTATVPGLTPASQTVTVAPAPAVELDVLTPPQTVLAGSCSAPVTLEPFDMLGNPVTAPDGGTAIALSSTAITTAFFANSDCTGSIQQATIPAGLAQATFYFQDNRAGMPTLSMVLAGVPDAGQTETIVAGAPARLTFTTPRQTVSVNTCSAVTTVAITDVVGNEVPLDAGVTVALASSSAGATLFSDALCTAPLTGLELDAGVTAGSFWFVDPNVGTSTLTAVAPMLLTGSQLETIVTPGAPASIVFASAPVTLEAAACSSALQLRLLDVNGNSAPVSAPLDLALTASGPVTFSTDPACSAPVTKVTVPPGEYRAAFRFDDAAAQTVTLTASAPGLDAGSQVEVTTCPLMADGAACDDLNLCNGHETCKGGVCTAATMPLSCDDSDLCTTDSCDPVSGCAHAVIAGCCRSPLVAAGNLSAAVGVPYLIAPGGVAVLTKGTGPIKWDACDTPPPGFHVDATTGEVDWVPQSAGAANICLHAVGSCGEDTGRFTVQVAASAPAAPVAALTVTPAELAAGASVSGDASASTGAAPLSFGWWWGDGATGGSAASAAHPYPLAGSYLVKVRVFDQVGQSADATQRVTVTGPGCSTVPVAQIAADPLSGAESLTVSFHDDVTPPAADAVYWWDFGDGSTAWGATASHTFTPGAYRVRLEVSAGGCTSSDSVEVRVTKAGRQPPRCALGVDPAGGVAPLRVTFSAVFGSGEGSVKSAEYSFSDGLSADAMQHGAQVTRTIDAPGTLTASLVVTDDAGLTCHTAVVARASSKDGLFPPQIVSVPGTTAKCGTMYAYDEDNTARAIGSGPISWSLGRGSGGAGVPNGMAIDATTGKLEWTPSLSTRGPTRVTVVASNAAGSTEQDFEVNVDCGKPSGCGCGSTGLESLAALALIAAWRRRRGR